MIFVTVGAQMPFDRLIRVVDQWAQSRKRNDVFAQIGSTTYRPEYIQWTAFMDPSEFRKKVEVADVVVAHAGMGSILTALELGKPILAMPRRGDLRETRNDHQFATAKQFLAQGRIFVAFDEDHLLEKLDSLNNLRPTGQIDANASPAMLAFLGAFIAGRRLDLPLVEKPFETVSRDIPSLETQLKRDRSRDSHPPDGPVEIPAIGYKMWHETARDDLLIGPRAFARDSFELRSRFSSAVDRGQPSSNETIKSGLISVILLAGRLRPTDLGRRIERSRLDLPVDANRSLLSYWRDEVVQLAALWGCKHLAIRVLLDKLSPTPTMPRDTQGISLSVERDQAEYRGTGGVLRDACAAYDDEAWVLVANASQILFKPLHEIVNKMADAGGDMNVVNEKDGVPNGLILLKCGVLRSISDVGFHDMKEQVLPAMARRRIVKVVSCHGSTSPPIHSLKDYTAALRRYHSGNARGVSNRNPFDEGWQPRFAIRQQGSVVADSAVIHDSVVLEGAAVERGAVVVRSVIERGCRVAPGQVVIDQVVN